MRKLFTCTSCLALVAAALFARAYTAPSSPQVIPSDQIAALLGTAAADSVPLSMEQLVGASSSIVVGRITSLESRWTDPRNLSTFVTIEVESALKGGAAGSLVVVTPGGSDANRRIPIAMTYPGAPRFMQDERVLVFLEPDPSGSGALAVTGFSQGKFSVVTDSDGREFVARDPVALRLGSGPGATYSTVQYVPLADVTTAIQALAQ